MFVIVAKLLLARLPFSYELWRFFGLFRHGSMDEIDYPTKIFDIHLSRAFPQGVRKELVILELGPGDSVVSGFLGFAKGVRCTYLVDIDSFARKDTAFYYSFAERMTKKGMRAPEILPDSSFNEILQKSNIKYLTSGLSSLRKIPSKSVDFVWSHSVIEHVRKCELEDFFYELYRIMKPSALASHNIDYQDHLNYSLNNLRFSEEVWESSFFSFKSGFYTNRVPAVKMHSMMRKAGFEIIDENFGKWPVLPTPRNSMHRDFDVFLDEELMNRTSHVLLKA